MKNYFLLLAGIATLTMHAQTSKLEIPAKQTLIEYHFLDKGGIYMQFTNVGGINRTATMTNKIVDVYDAAFAKTQSIPLDANNQYSYGFTSPTGVFKGFSDQGSSAFSDDTVYYLTTGTTFKNVKDKDNRGTLDKIKVFTTDDYQLYFGKQGKLKDKSVVKGEEYNELYFRRRDLKTMDIKAIPIKFPAEAVANGRLFYQYVSHDNTKVYFLLNTLENTKSSKCMLVSYDYDGKIVDKIPFTVSNSKDLMYFNNPHGINSVEMAKGGVMKEVRTEAATVKAVIAQDGFYVPGIMGSLEDGLTDGEGFYLYKFDFKGNKLWQIEKTLTNNDKKQKSRALYYGGDFNMALLGDKVAIWCDEQHTDRMFYYTINAENGSVLAEKQALVFADHESEWSKKKGYGGLKKANFVFDLDAKGSNSYDFTTIYALLVNPEVKKYVESKKESKFESHLDANGVFMIEENADETTFILTKFKW